MDSTLAPPSRSTAARFAPHALLAFIALLSIGGSVLVAVLAKLPDGAHDYNAAGFVVRHAWVKFGLLATEPFRGGLSREQEDERVARYFELNAAIRDKERTAGDPATPADQAQVASDEAAAMRDERAGIENSVELILEGRLTRVIKEAGLTRRFGGDVVWPPVNIEFEEPPSVLVTSPRSEIRKENERLLESDIPIDRVQDIERDAERDGNTSALVVDIGGIAMYPAIIPPSSNYRFVLDDIAHEWMHHYLYFAPLGRRYYDNGELTTLNETVANMVGEELGARLLAEYPLRGQRAPAPPPQPAPAAPAPFDFTTEMRNLRREVEALLAQGKVDEAERLMEEKREYLAANGYYIRKLNQAYFAFHGSYADTAGSIDPIGPKLQDLRANSDSLEQFVEAARSFTSEKDLDQALQLR